MIGSITRGPTGMVGALEDNVVRIDHFMVIRGVLRTVRKTNELYLI